MVNREGIVIIVIIIPSRFALSTSTGTLYIVELTVGFESNLQKNVERKKSKYKELIREQNEHFNSVTFVTSQASYSPEYITPTQKKSFY